MPWKSSNIVLSLFSQEGHDDSLCSLGECNVVRTEVHKSLDLTPYNVGWGPVTWSPQACFHLFPSAKHLAWE